MGSFVGMMGVVLMFASVFLFKMITILSIPIYTFLLGVLCLVVSHLWEQLGADDEDEEETI